MSTSSSTDKGIWPSVAPYIVPPVAAAVAIIPPFRDLVAKSALQKGEPVPKMSWKQGIMAGFSAAPTVGAIVGTQMVIQSIVERTITQGSNQGSLSSTLASSAIVGTLSAPALAIFNGQTMGWTVQESIRKFSAKQCMAIAVQETAFVGGLSVADKLAVAMRTIFGNNKAVDYTAAFIAGAAGSLAGHPANTALTRWQAGMRVETAQQLMWGSLRKARAVGCFSVAYKLGKEVLNPQ